MDIRIEKTERAIRNAFLELRAAKPLEKITVKELCSLACINKSTFYLKKLYHIHFLKCITKLHMEEKE